MSRRALLALCLVLGAAACGGATPSPSSGGIAQTAFETGAFRVAAEGPCARLSIAAIGGRRVLVYGDTGYDLAGWLPDDEVPAAQSLAVLTPQGAGIDARLLEGLPRDARGYVPGALELGGSRDDDAWLLRITTSYAPGGGGALFARESKGFRLGPDGWRHAAGQPVERPASTSRLGELPLDACGDGATFVPLASTTTSGGVFVAGRCDDARAANPARATLLVAHGRPSATAWQIQRIPGTENLDGIVNLAIDAWNDDDAVLTAWEPFVPMEQRHAFAARWRPRDHPGGAASWEPTTFDVPGGYVDVAHEPTGDVLVANGRGVFRVDRAGHSNRIPLPPPRFVRGSADDVYFHAVRTFDREVWIEARYRVWPAGWKPAVWASALLTNATLRRSLHCDASEPADRALTEVE